MSSTSYLLIDQSDSIPESQQNGERQSVNLERASMISPQQQQPQQQQQWRIGGNPMIFPATLAFLIFSFFLSFSPSESYLSQYLTQVKGITSDQLVDSIFPLWTYSYFAFSIFFALFSELIGYEVCVFSGAIAMLIANLMILTPIDYSPSDPAFLYVMQLNQVVAGYSAASIIVFNGLMFLSFEPTNYKTVTSVSHSLSLIATVSSSLLGQLCIWLADRRDQSNNGLILTVLISLLSKFFLLLSSVIFLCFRQYKKTRVCCAALPVGVIAEKTPSSLLYPLLSSIKNYSIELFAPLKSSTTLKWCVWKAMNLAVHQLVLTYFQSLVQQVGNGTSEWNGIVYALAYLIAGLTTLLPIRVFDLLNRRRDTIAIVFSLLPSLFCLMMGVSDSQLWLVYIGFVCYMSVSEFMIPVSNCFLALQVSNDRFAPVLGVSVLLGLFFQSLLQLVIGPQVLALDLSQQFVSFSIFLFALSLGSSIDAIAKKFL